MSQPGGRGFGKPGGRSDPRKKPPLEKKTFSGRSATSRGISTVKIGETTGGFPQLSIAESLIAQTEALSLGESANIGKALGRGSIRNRKQIAAMNLLKTKPDSCVNKKGDAGTRLELTSNYFKVETPADWVLFQYRVDFNVEEERERVLRSWLRQHKEKLSTAYLFDGASIFTSQRLTVENQPLNLTSVRESDNFPVQITIKLVQQLKYGNSAYMQVFNILVRRCLLHLKLHLVNRNFFDPMASIQLRQHNLEIWPGYVTSIRQHENSILMCTEISHKVMRTDTALKHLSECAQESKDFKRLFQQSMIGAIVLTDYNNKTYRIDDVDFSQNPTSSFKYKDGTSITYLKYYEQRYQIKIQDLRQPLLISRIQGKFFKESEDRQCILIPELCRMTGLSNKMLENRVLMRDLADITRVSPGVRIKKLKAFNLRLQSEEAIIKDFQQWGMKINQNLLTIPGRLLPQEQIIAGGSRTYPTGPDVDWSRNLRSNPMLLNGRFDSFVIICPGRIRRETEEFMACLKKAADGMSFRIPKPIILETRSDAPQEMIEAIEIAIGRYSPDLIMFAFLTDRADRYSLVKKKCYVDRAIPSQVILARSMKSKGVMSIATKVAVQLNCKLGGAPWTVQIPTEYLMVIGFDVCHDSSKKSKSVGALVASLNNTMSSWYSTTNFHSGGEEISETLPSDICTAIKKYKEVNGNVLPNRIIVYRDGVGEGQINHVYNQEVTNLKRRLSELYGSNNWKLAYIIVTKRLNTRLFFRDDNPRPGTVVDDVVTLPEFYDFFLVSQSVRQGTVSPTGYNVISDNTGWGPNHIQRLTYKLTHLYYNCSVTVRVPAPCQYAHKLAFMVSQNLLIRPNPNLNDRLYYL